MAVAASDETDALRLEAIDATWEELASGSPAVIGAWRGATQRGRARLGEPRASALFEEGRRMSWDQVEKTAR
jgi:hypothetical protein